MITVTVCVGSSCHVKGAREIIARFKDFLAKEGLEDKVELKGSFCMEHCGKGINWKINNEIISSPSVEKGVETLQKKVLAFLKDNNIPEKPVEDSNRRRI